MEDILFFRNRPKVFNLGDYLCTPVHYFDFGCREHETGFFLKGKTYKVVLGGGAYNDFGLGLNIPFDKAVLWGVGSSCHGKDSFPKKADSLPYVLYGLRDPDAVTDSKKILPCVSCLHPITKLSPGNGTAIFLNYDQAITSVQLINELSNSNEGRNKVYTNNLSEFRFMQAFSGAGRVITNSYHITYWSLLSGREVAVIGYSSKFRSLLKLFGLDPSLISHYSVSNQEDLKKAINNIIKENHFFKIENSGDYRSEFSKLNIKFAEECKKIGFVEDFKLKKFSPLERYNRMINYNILQTFANLRK